jgi:hypothetical protein
MKKKHGAKKAKITKCVILEPTGEEDLERLAKLLGPRAGSRSMRIRLALHMAARVFHGTNLDGVLDGYLGREEKERG